MRKSRLLLLIVLLVFAPSVFAQQMRKEEEPEEVGMVLIGSSYFPKPEGAIEIPVPNAGFEETKDGKPVAWEIRNGDVIASDTAPEGKHYYACNGGLGQVLVMSNLDVRGNRPHLISFWLKSEKPFSAGFDLEKADTHYGRSVWIGLPSTGGQWKRVGCYFRNLPGGVNGRFSVWGRAGNPIPPFEIDDMQLIVTTEAEFSRGWAAWRTKYPERDLSQRPTDGACMPLAMRKLSRGFDPQKPFLIWAIGSSYTNMLGNGETPRQHILKRYPNAPEIVYKKHVGSAVPWQYVHGWAHTIVIPEQPDLIIIYTIRGIDYLDRMLADFRRHTTADIVVPSIHWRIRDIKNWDKSEDAADQNVQELRDVCKKYGVEFVESRQEWAEYLRKHNLKVEIDPIGNLLKDGVHQSDHGALVINENIARHFYVPANPAYNPDERERRLTASGARSIRDAEKVEADDKWVKTEPHLATSEKDARIKVRFVGNRIDLVGVKSPDGGTAKIVIDGRPADQAEVFFASYIASSQKNAAPSAGRREDRSPHGVLLGKNIVPQKWTIRMIDDSGNYELVGSVTGKDGEGNNQQDYTSNSGQIVVPAEWWRNSVVTKGREKTVVGFVNKKGDEWYFDVTRCALGAVSFKGQAGERFYAKLVQNLPNAVHDLELIAAGDGKVAVEAFDVFEPPLKD